MIMDQQQQAASMEVGEGTSNAAILQNLMVLYAVVMSLGLGTAISGTLYYIYDTAVAKI